MCKNKLWIPLMFVAAVAGCSDDEEVGLDGAGGTNNEEVAALYACDEPDFAVLMPFTGPGVDAADGSIMPLTQSRYIVHTTQLLVKPEAQDEVFALTADIISTIMEMPGFVAMSLAGSEQCGNVRTLGIWESEKALYEFVASDAHAKAMARTTAISFTGKVTHWEATPEEAEVVDWAVAKTKIDATSPSPLYD